MSVIKTRKTTCGDIHYEMFDSAAEVVETCKTRKITSGSFDDMQREYLKKDWHGVKNYDEALEMMRTGYQPSVEALRGAMKVTASGEGKRFSFKNSIQGFAPVVPLALMGVPNSMLDMRMKPIKAKVVDVYYDMTVSCGVEPKQILDNGNRLLGAIVELERQGYRFNLYAVQTYSSSSNADMMVVRVKNSSQPLDIKRVSFPLTHTSFFRVIGFDWYSKVPGGKYRGGYGCGIAYDHNESELGQMAKEMFGNNAIYFAAAKILRKSKNHLKEVLTNGNSKA